MRCVSYLHCAAICINSCRYASVWLSMSFYFEFAGYEQWEFKCGTASFNGLHFDHRTVCFDDLAHQRKPQPRAAIAACGGTIQLMEWFKDVIQPIGWNSNPCICDGDNDKIFPFTLDTDDHASTRRCEFDPVINQLVQHPGDLLWIRLDERHILINDRVQIDAAFQCLGCMRI